MSIQLELAISLVQQGKFEEARPIFEAALKDDPEHVISLSNLAICCRMMGENERALELAHKAANLSRNFEQWANLGLMCHELGLYSESSGYLEKALEFQKVSYLLCKQSINYWRLRRYREAILCCQRGLAIDPERLELHFNRGLSSLMLGDLYFGFVGYEKRIELFEEMRLYREHYDQKKRWRGEADITGKTVLVYAEQGLGDAIFFARWLPELRARARVILHCNEKLNRLLGDLVDEVFTGPLDSHEYPDYEFQCCIGSLPLLLNSFSRLNAPYLSCEHRPSGTWGIVAAGNPDHPNDKARSVPEEELKPLLVRRDVEPLQFGEDLFETARIIEELEGVITCDTAVLHLAGAMGIPCHAMIGYESDWRWEVSGGETDWYPSVTLHRQSASGGWSDVVWSINRHLAQT